MIVDSKKLSDTNIEITEQAPMPAPKVTNHNRAFVKAQKLSIQKQLDDFTVERQKEIAKYDAILSEMDKLGVVKEIETIGDIK